MYSLPKTINFTFYTFTGSVPAAACVDQLPMKKEQDIYSAVDLGSFQFTPRCNPFNWRLLHGLDVDALVSFVA